MQQAVQQYDVIDSLVWATWNRRAIEADRKLFLLEYTAGEDSIFRSAGLDGLGQIYWIIFFES